jgi:hypothetical protein
MDATHGVGAAVVVVAAGPEVVVVVAAGGAAVVVVVSSLSLPQAAATIASAISSATIRQIDPFLICFPFRFF